MKREEGKESVGILLRRKGGRKDQTLVFSSLIKKKKERDETPIFFADGSGQSRREKRLASLNYQS